MPTFVFVDFFFEEEVVYECTGCVKKSRWQGNLRIETMLLAFKKNHYMLRFRLADLNYSLQPILLRFYFLCLS